MSAYLVGLSTWLHVLATIVWIGYYVYTSLIFLPVLVRRMKANDLRDLLEQFSARLRPFFGGALLKGVRHTLYAEFLKGDGR